MRRQRRAWDTDEIAARDAALTVGRWPELVATVRRRLVARAVVASLAPVVALSSCVAVATALEEAEPGKVWPWMFGVLALWALGLARLHAAKTAARAAADDLPFALSSAVQHRDGDAAALVGRVYVRAAARRLREVPAGLLHWGALCDELDCPDLEIELARSLARGSTQTVGDVLAVARAAVEHQRG